MYYNKRGVLIISILLLFLPLVMAESIFIGNKTTFDEGHYFSTAYSDNYNGVTLTLGSYLGNYTYSLDAMEEVEWTRLTWNQNTHSILVLVDTQEGIGKSVTSGTNWIRTHSDFNLVSTNAVDLVSLSNGTLVVVDLNETIWQSNDFGYSWIKINEDYNYAETQDASVMMRDLSDRLYIFETDEEVWRSDTYGRTWMKVNTNFDRSISTANARGAVSNLNNNLFVITSDGDVYHSLDLGVNWEELTSDYNLGEPDFVSDLTIDGNGSLYILSNQAVWKSSNGINWDKIVNDFNGAKTIIGRLILFDTDYSYIIDGSENLYRSKNHGSNWSLFKNNLNGPNGDILSMSYYTMPLLSFGVTTNYTFIPLTFNLTGRYLDLVSYFTTYDLDYSPILYNFTAYYNSLPQPPKIPIVYSPINGSTIFSDSTILNVSVTDPDSSTLEVSFYGRDSLLDKQNVSNGTNLNYLWTNLSQDTYSWYTLVSDGTKTIHSGIYYFNVDLYPQLFNLYNFSTNDSVLIGWRSSELTNTTIRYGENLSLLTWALDSPFLLDHIVYLTNLTNATTYYYFIDYCDLSNHCQTQGPYAFLTDQNPFTDTLPPLITLISPLNDTSDLDGNIFFEFTTLDDSSLLNCALLVNSLAFIPLNTTNFTLPFNAGYYSWNISCVDSYYNIGTSETRNLFSKLSMTNFSGNTTDLRTANLSSVNLTIQKTESGTIDFLTLINLSGGANFDEGVKIYSNYVEVNSTLLPMLNTSARITLENLSFLNPRLLKNGNVCLDCVISSYHDGNLVFTTKGFSFYTAEETPSITLDNGGNSGGSSSTLPIREDTIGRGEDNSLGVRQTTTDSETIRRDVSLVNLGEEENVAPLISGFTVLMGEPLPRLSLTILLIGTSGLGISYAKTYLSTKPRRKTKR